MSNVNQTGDPVYDKLLADGWSRRSGGIPRCDAVVHYANAFTTTGYAKSYKGWTENLPEQVYGTDSEWGMLFFIAENTEELTGTQIFYPIDGPYNGRMFSRSLKHMSYDEPEIGDWMLVAVASDVSSKEDKHTVLTATLVTGETTLSFTNSAISDTARIRIYTSEYGVQPTAAEQSGTTLTLTFAVRNSDLGVKVEVS